jgi:hypothetical protein
MLTGATTGGDLAPRHAELDVDREVRCRLCSGDLLPVFEKLVMRQLRVAYFRCTQCGSLQTERPYWLTEAYSPTAPPLDLQAMGRALAVRSFTYRVLDLLAIPRQVTLIDWGAGNGILVRLLREAGTDAYCYDKYVRPLFTEARTPPAKCDVITAFEVWEHFADPLAETDSIFGHRPAIHIVSTEFHSGQSEDWAYLHPEIGRHTFFYSEGALHFVAQRHGYDVICGSRFAVFFVGTIKASVRGELRALLQSPSDILAERA